MPSPDLSTNFIRSQILSPYNPPTSTTESPSSNNNNRTTHIINNNNHNNYSPSARNSNNNNNMTTKCFSDDEYRLFNAKYGNVSQNPSSQMMRKTASPVFLQVVDYSTQVEHLVKGYT